MIASIINGVSPILISDLLISSSHKPEEMRIPAVPDNLIKYLPDASGFYPFGVNQKSYILKKNVCVAFSGKVLYFKNFLEDLKIFCKIYDLVDIDKLSLFLNEKKDETWEEFSFIIHLIVDYEQPTGIARYVHGNGHYKDTEMFGEIYSSGSGSEDFIIESLVQATFQTKESNEYLRTVQINAILICRLLCREWLSLYTVANLWGGGFELVYVKNGIFHKADRMTYVINHEKFDADGKLSFPKPQAIFHYRYHEDVLVITVVRPTGGEIEHSEEYYIIRSSNVHFEQFFVYPIDNHPMEKEDKIECDSSFSSITVAMGYVFEKDDIKFIPASFHNGPDLHVMYVHENGITIKMKKYVNDLIVKAAEDAFPSL